MVEAKPTLSTDDMTDWSKLKVVDLKKELSSRNLPQNGLKQDLVNRLTTDDEAKDAVKESASEEVGDASGGDGEGNGEGDEDTLDAKEKDDGASQTVSMTRGGLLNGKDEIAGEGVSANVVAEGLNAGSEVLEGSTLIETSVEEKKPAQTTGEAISVVAEPEVVSQDVSPATEIEPQQTIQQESSANPEKVEGPKEEVISDSQKRKRRSLTPDISSEEASKKMRHDEQKPEVQEDVVMTTRDDAEWIEKHNGVDPAEVNADAMEVDSSNAEPTIVDIAKEEVVVEKTEAHANEETRSNIDFNTESPNLSRSQDNGIQDSFTESDTNKDNNMAEEDPMEGVETDRMISPAIHSATKALYIRNFMRPLNTAGLKEHLARLATPPSSQTDLSIISEFHMDAIRTHAFVCFSNVSAASRVRSTIHDTTWPEEKNRKPLWADFIPADKVRDWIEEEENTTGRRGSTGKNWEVAYEDDGYGSIVAVLRESDPRNIPARQVTRGMALGGGMGRMGPPPPPISRNNMNANNVPLGPRSNIPLDPNPYEKRNDMESRRPSSNFQDRPLASRPEPSPVNNKDFMYTVTTPRLFYQAVTKDVVNKRLDNMDAITRRDYRPDEASKEINRYTFEDGTRFVDRGPEIFEGIRPPRGALRSRGVERGGGGGGYRGERRRDVDRYATGGGGPPRGGRRFSGGGGGGGGGFRGDDGYRGGGIRRY